MSILASTSPASNPIPAGSAQARCPGCGTPVPVTDGSAATCCTTCRRSQVENEARRLLADVRDLATDDEKPATKTAEQALRDLVDVLPDSSVDLLADLVSRRIAERKRQSKGEARTLVRVAIADLSDAALIDLVGETEDPILLNAASAEVEGRLGRFTGEEPKPLFTQVTNAAPDPATRYELEGRIAVPGEPIDTVEPGFTKAA